VQVAATTPQSAQSSVALKFQVAQTAGNLNVIVVGWTGSSAHITGVTDSAGNAYALAVGPTVQSGVESAAIYYAMNIAAAAANTVTVKFDSPAPYVDLRLAEYTGVATSGALDAVAAAAGNGGSGNSGTLTTSLAQDLLVGNIATETLLATLAECGASLPKLAPLDGLIAANAELVSRFGSAGRSVH